MASQDIISEIDETIDRLIENSIALESIESDSESYDLEKNLLEQMQESLLAHLFHLDELYAKKKPSIMDAKKIEAIATDPLSFLSCSSQIKKSKIKLSKIRLKNKAYKS
jgi:hypothetical protein